MPVKNLKKDSKTIKYQVSHVLTKAFKTAPLSGYSNLVTQSSTVNDAYHIILYLSEYWILGNKCIFLLLL
jgi:hypothetical protein